MRPLIVMSIALAAVGCYRLDEGVELACQRFRVREVRPSRRAVRERGPIMTPAPAGAYNSGHEQTFIHGRVRWWAVYDECGWLVDEDWWCDRIPRDGRHWARCYPRRATDAVLRRKRLDWR